MARALHHLDLWVDDVATAEGEWGWLLAWCGWQREDGMRSWVHADRYPHAGGEEHVALFVENSEGFEVEVVVEP